MFGYLSSSPYMGIYLCVFLRASNYDKKEVNVHNWIHYSSSNSFINDRKRQTSKVGEREKFLKNISRFKVPKWPLWLISNRLVKLLSWCGHNFFPITNLLVWRDNISFGCPFQVLQNNLVAQVLKDTNKFVPCNVEFILA